MKDQRPISEFKFTQEEYDRYQAGEEIWRDIEGYEGLYQISTNGRVKSLARIIHRSSQDMNIKEKIKDQLIGTTGYYYVGLSNYGKGKSCKINRLVCNEFLRNPLNKKCTNHIDGNKLNNNLSNFEWATHGENNSHAYRIGLKISHLKGKFGADCKKSKNIIQFDMNGNFIKMFHGGQEAARYLGLRQSNISAAAIGISNSCGGFKWMYEQDYLSLHKSKNDLNGKEGKKRADTTIV